MHHLLCRVVNFITALGAVVYGLKALNVDVLAKVGMGAHETYLMYLFLISGVISIILLFACGDKCKCEMK